MTDIYKEAAQEVLKLTQDQEPILQTLGRLQVSPGTTEGHLELAEEVSALPAYDRLQLLRSWMDQLRKVYDDAKREAFLVAYGGKAQD